MIKIQARKLSHIEVEEVMKKKKAKEECYQIPVKPR